MVATVKRLGDHQVDKGLKKFSYKLGPSLVGGNWEDPAGKVQITWETRLKGEGMKKGENLRGLGGISSTVPCEFQLAG